MLCAGALKQSSEFLEKVEIYYKYILVLVHFKVILHHMHVSCVKTGEVGTVYIGVTDNIDLYPNSDVNHALHAGEYIRSLQFSVFTDAI